MALDKQKILNELGNVVNQLQSADCGCMGKLFSNSGEASSNSNSMSNDFNGGMRSCCGHHGHHGHHGYNAPCAGEPYSGAQQCMGFCNPPKLYADTYNYLNNNMMQPVVQEVYDDLKSINPNNTVMNNPIAGQMGLSQESNPNQGNMSQNAMHAHNPHINFGDTLQNPEQRDIYHDQQEMNHIGQGMGEIMSNSGPGMNQMSQEIGQAEYGIGQVRQVMGQNPGSKAQGMHHAGQMMAGMGPQIANMMSSSGRNNVMPNQGDPTSATDNGPYSPEMGQIMPRMAGYPQMGQYDPGQMQNNALNMNHNNLDNNITRTSLGGAAPGNNTMSPNIHQHSRKPQIMGNTNPRQVNNSNPYGQHSAGIAKFNEMFPGVMKSDLGFDPMAIAIQMNPANQQKSAMDTMQKMMMNNSGGMSRIMDSPHMQPVVNATNSVNASLSQPNQQLSSQATDQNVLQQRPGEIPSGGMMQNNQIPQQVYTAMNGASTMNQQQISNKQHPDRQVQQQLTGSLPTVYEGLEEPLSSQQQQQPSAHVVQSIATTKHINKEPIFLADTSRHLLQSHHFKPRKYDYNTLGQPVQMVSAVDYQTLPPVLPPVVYANVKPTVSKTAIVGNRPLGKIPSRSQLHHEYNQYKGSQSFTQQNIRPSGYTGSHSEGRINVPQGNTPQQYIERVGGDTVVNDQLRTQTKLESNIDQIGDVPEAKKQPDHYGMNRLRNNKTRNGLQDQVFLSYPSSAKWSFHGTNPAPYSVGYRFKAK